MCGEPLKPPLRQFWSPERLTRARIAASSSEGFLSNRGNPKCRRAESFVLGFCVILRFERRRPCAFCRCGQFDSGRSARVGAGTRGPAPASTGIALVADSCGLEAEA